MSGTVTSTSSSLLRLGNAEGPLLCCQSFEADQPQAARLRHAGSPAPAGSDVQLRALSRPLSCALGILRTRRCSGSACGSQLRQEPTLGTPALNRRSRPKADDARSAGEKRSLSAARSGMRHRSGSASRAKERIRTDNAGPTTRVSMVKWKGIALLWPTSHPLHAIQKSGVSHACV